MKKTRILSLSSAQTAKTFGNITMKLSSHIKYY
jgi:hypothetical protein